MTDMFGLNFLFQIVGAETSHAIPIFQFEHELANDFAVHFLGIEGRVVEQNLDAVCASFFQATG